MRETAVKLISFFQEILTLYEVYNLSVSALLAFFGDCP